MHLASTHICFQSVLVQKQVVGLRGTPKQTICCQLSNESQRHFFGLVPTRLFIGEKKNKTDTQGIRFALSQNQQNNNSLTVFNRILTD